MTREHNEWTREDFYIVGFLAIFFVILPLILILPERSEPTCEQDSGVPYTYRPEPHKSAAKQHVNTFEFSRTNEDELIDKLGREDYYEHSDYHDGLDGEHSDIDFDEVSDYYKD